MSRLGLPKRAKRIVRLFLSVDVYDSTALKKANSDGAIPAWLVKLRSFFLRYPEELAKACSDCELQPKLWKCLGDEIVFYADVASPEQVRRLLLAFKKATLNFQTDGVALKNTAWLADFPGRNFEVTVPSPNRHGSQKDFLGPQMDLGFRLTSRSTKRKFAISVDLALVVVAANVGLEVHYQGKEVLKGVLDRKEYPMLWIDMSDKSDLEDRLIICPTPFDVKQFCLEFIEKTDGLSKPYFPGHAEFDDKPADWDRCLEIAARLAHAEEEAPEGLPKEIGVQPGEAEIKAVISAAEQAIKPAEPPLERKARE